MQMTSLDTTLNPAFYGFRAREFALGLRKLMLHLERRARVLTSARASLRVVVSDRGASEA